MKTTIVFATLLATLSISAFADQYVRGHARKDGTYVAPHHRSDPNSHRYDNYSSQGNANPYTGQQGHQRNELSSPYQGNQQTRPNPYGNNPFR